MALSRMVGFDVTPRMPSTSTSCFRPPPVSSGRARLSYQGLWPNSFSRAIALAMSHSSVLDQRAGARGDMLRGEAELLHCHRSRCGRAEVVDADDVVGVALPAEGGACFHGERGDVGGQHLVAV